MEWNLNLTAVILGGRLVTVGKYSRYVWMSGVPIFGNGTQLSSRPYTHPLAHTSTHTPNDSCVVLFLSSGEGVRLLPVRGSRPMTHVAHPPAHPPNHTPNDSCLVLFLSTGESVHLLPVRGSRPTLTPTHLPTRPMTHVLYCFSLQVKAYGYYLFEGHAHTPTRPSSLPPTRPSSHPHAQWLMYCIVSLCR